MEKIFPFYQNMLNSVRDVTSIAKGLVLAFKQITLPCKPSKSDDSQF